MNQSVSIVALDTDTASFTEFGLDERLQSAIIAMGYTNTTPIQTKAIPLIMQGVDVMGAAQTGTGKTAAFSLPLLHRLLPMASNSSSPARHPIRGLILAPTRELADQIESNVKQFSDHTPIRVAAVFGGIDFKPQEVILRSGVDVLIATPGRLLDHIANKAINLSQVSILVLDEADRMLDMGFMPDLERIVALLPKQRQTLLFSATFSDPIRKLAQTFLTQANPQSIETSKRNATSINITQRLIEVQSKQLKETTLIALLKSKSKQINNNNNNKIIHVPQTIIFLNSKLGCGRLTRHLQHTGFKVQAIHGDRSQPERLATLNDFKAQQIDILVATDVAARGLDIADLPCVINYDLPFNAEDYVHRIGRTGRAGATGLAYTLYSPDEAKLLQDIESFIKAKLERETVDMPIAEDREHVREVRQRRNESIERNNERAWLHAEHIRPLKYRYDPLFTELYVPSSSNLPRHTVPTQYKQLKTHFKITPIIAALFRKEAFKGIVE